MSDSPASPRVIALAGNPNTGKSSIFNMLTGAKQHVGNWPGKTVERVDGRFTYDGDEFDLVDLPGTYSLNASSPEEMIARDFLVGGEPDGAVVVVDAANLERNLYLAIQVLEIGIPTVVAVNMSDVARSRGLEIDPMVLSDRLEAPAVATVARTGKGLDDLRDVIAATCVREESR
jgi:ferrous iron transport protein B